MIVLPVRFSGNHTLHCQEWERDNPVGLFFLTPNLAIYDFWTIESQIQVRLACQLRGLDPVWSKADIHIKSHHCHRVLCRQVTAEGLRTEWAMKPDFPMLALWKSLAEDHTLMVTPSVTVLLLKGLRFQGCRAGTFHQHSRTFLMEELRIKLKNTWLGETQHLFTPPYKREMAPTSKACHCGTLAPLFVKWLQSTRKWDSGI